MTTIGYNSPILLFFDDFHQKCRSLGGSLTHPSFFYLVDVCYTSLITRYMMLCNDHHQQYNCSWCSSHAYIHTCWSCNDHTMYVCIHYICNVFIKNFYKNFFMTALVGVVDVYDHWSWTSRSLWGVCFSLLKNVMIKNWPWPKNDPIFDPPGPPPKNATWQHCFPHKGDQVHSVRKYRFF